MNIGKSVVIKGDLTASEDLTIEGQVEGKIELRHNILTIGANGKIKAQVLAKAVVVLGEVHGQRHRDRARGHPRQRVGRRRSVGTAYRDCRRRALPRQHRHAEAGQAGREQAGARPSPRRQRPSPRRSPPAPVGASRPRHRSRSELTCRRCSSGEGGRTLRRPLRPLRPFRAESDPVSTTKVLPRVSSALASQPDAGPHGPRSRRRGEHLVLRRAALLQDSRRGSVRRRRAARAGRARAKRSPSLLPGALTRAAGSIDGILCWDLFDYLDKTSGQALAARLVDVAQAGRHRLRLLRPDGGRRSTTYTRFIVESPDHVPAPDRAGDAHGAHGASSTAISARCSPA